MLSRRDLLIRVGLAGAAAFARPITTALATAAQPSTPVNFNVPAGACDCHTHIIQDPQKFPFLPSRAYTPETASVAEMRSLHRTLHIERVVIVQPTFYGTSNACTLDAIGQIGPSARGIAVIGDKTSNAELDEMHRGGIRGIRIHVDAPGPKDPAFVRRQFKAAVDRIKGRDWHVEVVASQLWEIEAMKDDLMASATPVSFDLFGGAKPALGIHQSGFDTLLGLLRGGKVYVNVSGPYRISNQAPDYSDVVPIAKALIAANPRRIIWGSDWPHTQQIPGRPANEATPLFQIDDGNDLNLLATWTSSAQLKLIFVENPARLYGF